MQIGQENFYVDPADGTPFRLMDAVFRGDQVIDGRLLSEGGREFFIRDGIPNLVYPFDLPKTDLESLRQSEAHAEGYDRYIPLTFSTYGEDEERVRAAMVDRLKLREDAVVLEIGAGTGRDSQHIVSRLGAGGRLYYQDLSPSFLVQNVRRMQALGADAEPALANGYFLPFRDDSLDACFSFGGINAFADIRRAFAEMARVTRPGGRVVVGDECMPPWLRETEFGKILMNSNPEFCYPLPLDKLPVEARNTNIQWIIGGVFYLIDFDVGVGEPPADLDFPIPGVRGGTHRTRYYGQLEGVTPEVKLLAHKARAATGKSMHQWLDDTVRSAALRDLGESNEGAS